MHRVVLIFLYLVSTASADWKSSAESRIEQFRKGDFFLQVNLPSTTDDVFLQVELIRHHFLFGTFITSDLIGQPDENAGKYTRFVAENFNAVTFEKELLWTFQEPQPNRPNQHHTEPAKRLFRFAQQHHLAVRGYALLQTQAKHIPAWLQFLSEKKIWKHLNNRLHRLMNSYPNVFCWDVMTDMLDGSFFEDRLGLKARARIYQQARVERPLVPLFVNEYGILEDDEKLTRLVQLIERLREQDAPIDGIGIQLHNGERLAPGNDEAISPETFFRRLEVLGKFDRPIHLTEVSFKNRDDDQQTAALETCFYLAFSHPRIEALILRGFYEPVHWLGHEAALIQEPWRIRPAAEKLQELLRKTWHTQLAFETTAPANVKFRGFYGTYQIRAQAGDNVFTGQAVFTPQNLKNTVTLIPLQAQAVPKETPTLEEEVSLWKEQTPGAVWEPKMEVEKSDEKSD